MKTHGQSLHELVVAHLKECEKHIDAEVYFKALAAIKDAKSADTRNIYIIALEKQVKLLSDLSKQRPSDSANKNEIRATIPEIIRRAIEDARKRSELNKTKDTQSQVNDVEDNPYFRERDLAFKKLKSQFINLAEEFINNGDYQSALEEIRRIFIIDPDNKAAKDLEKKIESLMDYRGEGDPETDDIDTGKKNGKSKSFKIGKAIPLIIAFLVVANLIIFFITSMVSDDDPYSGEISEVRSDNSASSPYVDHPRQNENPEGESTSPPQTSGTIPDELLLYRETVAVLNEIEDETPEFTDEYHSEPMETTLTDAVDEVLDDPEIVAEAEIVETDIFAVDPVDETERMNARVYVSEPESIVRLEQPVYPAEALQRGIEGDVVIRVLYDAQGLVNVSFVESSDHPLLSESALTSARLSRFTPADSADFDGPQWVTIPYQYRLDQ